MSLPCPRLEGLVRTHVEKRCRNGVVDPQGGLERSRGTAGVYTLDGRDTIGERFSVLGRRAWP
jgi:hypothetical protein